LKIGQHTLKLCTNVGWHGFLTHSIYYFMEFALTVETRVEISNLSKLAF